MKLQENINRIKQVMGLINEEDSIHFDMQDLLDDDTINSDQTQEQNESEITERCWKGYTQKGMKTMFGKRYPNCVKKTK